MLVLLVMVLVEGGRGGEGDIVVEGRGFVRLVRGRAAGAGGRRGAGVEEEVGQGHGVVMEWRGGGGKEKQRQATPCACVVEGEMEHKSERRWLKENEDGTNTTINNCTL